MSLAMDELQLTGQTLGRVFKSSRGCMNAPVEIQKKTVQLKVAKLGPKSF
jgi:hypothetical protein